MSTVKDMFGIGLVMLISIPFTAAFIAWLTVLPSIGLLWLAGWLK